MLDRGEAFDVGPIIDLGGYRNERVYLHTGVPGTYGEWLGQLECSWECWAGSVAMNLQLESRNGNRVGAGLHTHLKCI